jgi:glutathione S-transferase
MNPKQLWHHLLDQWTDEIGGQQFFGGDEPDLVDLIVYGYMRSIEMHPKAFRHIDDHENGMAWFKRMKGVAA